jgi:hypothetical protein
MLVDESEIARRKTDGIPPVPKDATPWQRLYRQTVTQLANGATIRDAEEFGRSPRPRRGTTTDVPRRGNCNLRPEKST